MSPPNTIELLIPWSSLSHATFHLFTFAVLLASGHRRCSSGYGRQNDNDSLRGKGEHILQQTARLTKTENKTKTEKAIILMGLLWTDNSSRALTSYQKAGRAQVCSKFSVGELWDAEYSAHDASRLLWNSKVHYRVNYSQPEHSALSNPVHIFNLSV